MEKQGGDFHLHNHRFHDLSYPDGFSIPVPMIRPDLALIQGMPSPRIHFYDMFTGKVLSTYGDTGNTTGSVTTLDCNVTISGETNKVALIKHVLNSLSSVRTNLEKEGKIFSGSGMLITFNDSTGRKLILGENKNGKLEDFGGYMFSLLVLNNVPLQANAIKETYEESKCLFSIQGAYEKKIDSNSYVDISNDVDGTYYRCHGINLTGCDLANVSALFGNNQNTIQKRLLKEFTDSSFHEINKLEVIPVSAIDASKPRFSDRLSKIINAFGSNINGTLAQFQCTTGNISTPNVNTIFAM